MAPSTKAKGKAGATKGKGKAKGNLALPTIAGVENAAEVEAAKGTSYYTGPLPPASIYRVKLTLLFLTDNRSGDPRITWVARIDEEHAARQKFNGYSFINGENVSEQGLPYVNAMLDAMGIDRDEFHGGGIRVDNPNANRSNGERMIVEAVGKQATTEDAELYFYIAAKKQKAYNSDEIELGHQAYMSEEQWEAVVSNLDEADDDDTEDDEETEDDTEVETEDDEDDEESDDEDEEDEDEDEDEEEDDDEEDDEEDDEDDEPDLTELSEKDLKARVVEDKRWKDFTKTAQLKGYKKDSLVDMLQNGPQEPEKKGKKAKKGGSSKTPF